MIKLKPNFLKFISKRNLMLVLILIIQTKLICQTRCEKVDDPIAFSTIGSENGPRPNISSKVLINLINTDIEIKNFPSNYGQDFFIVFNINCKGEDFNYQFIAKKDGKVFTDSISKFQELLINYLDSTVSWIPGKSNLSSNGLVPWRVVDYQLTYRFIAKKKKFNLIDKFE